MSFASVPCFPFPSPRTLPSAFPLCPSLIFCPPLLQCWFPLDIFGGRILIQRQPLRTDARGDLASASRFAVGCQSGACICSTLLQKRAAEAAPLSIFHFPTVPSCGPCAAAPYASRQRARHARITHKQAERPVSPFSSARHATALWRFFLPAHVSQKFVQNKQAGLAEVRQASMRTIAAMALPAEAGPAVSCP